MIKTKQFDSAKQVLERGKKAGWAGEKVDALEEQLATPTQAAESALPEQDKNSGLKVAGPSDSEINNLSLLYQSKQFDEAEKLALSLTERFPQHVLGWKILGASLNQTGRALES